MFINLTYTTSLCASRLTVNLFQPRSRRSMFADVLNGTPVARRAALLVLSGVFVNHLTHEPLGGIKLSPFTFCEISPNPDELRT